jgi:hypothetical protein
MQPTQVKLEVEEPTPEQHAPVLPTPIKSSAPVKVERSVRRIRQSNQPRTTSSRNQIEAALIQYITDLQDDEIVDVTMHEMNTLPIYKRRKNPIVVIKSAAASDKAVGAIRAELLRAQQRKRNAPNHNHLFNTLQFVGFDIQRKSDQWTRKQHPALMIISTFDTSYLFRMKYKGINQQDSPMTKSLQCLLSDSSIIKVGAGIRNEVRELKREYGNECCGNGESFLDLIPLAKQRWPEMKKCGLRHMTATILRRELTRAQQNKNWEVNTLTPAMKAYAATGASVSLVLFAAIVLRFDGYCLTIQG